MNKPFLLLTFLVTVSLTACGRSALPVSRPDDFTARMSYDGGMIPEGESVRVDSEGARYVFSNESVDVEVTQTVSTEELDALYTTFRENNFTQITTTEEEVYDRGGISVSMTADGETYRVSDSGMDFVKERWSDEFSAVVSAMGQYMGSGGESTHRFIIAWDFSMWGLDTVISIDGISDDLVDIRSYWELEDASGVEVFVSQPGTYTLSIRIGDNDEVVQQTQIDTSTQTGVKLIWFNSVVIEPLQ